MSQNEKALSFIAYIPFLFLVGLIMEPNSGKLRFHCNQGLILTIYSVVCGVVTGLLKLLFGLIFFISPNVGNLFGNMFSLLFSFTVLILFINGIVNVNNDKFKELPFIGHFRIIQ